MLYYGSTIRGFLSHYAACASLAVLTLWFILDVVFIRTLGVCGAPVTDKPMIECNFLHKYHYGSVLLKRFDADYAPVSFLGRAFRVYDEASHNKDHVCGRTFGAAKAAASYCGKRTGIGYATTVSLILFYVWGPLVVCWHILKRLLVRKVVPYGTG